MQINKRGMKLKKHLIIKTSGIKPLNIDLKIVLLFTLFLCGIIFGAMIVSGNNNGLCDIFEKIISNSINEKSKFTFIKYFFSVFSGFLIIIIFDYLCGICGLGVPLLYVTPVALGVFFGVVISQFYISYGLSGVGYCVLINVPCYAITAATLIKCCCFSKIMSEELFLYLVSGKSDKKDVSLKTYSLKYLIYSVMVALASLISALSFKLFSHLFGFI